jgi:hypothetical protein
MLRARLTTVDNPHDPFDNYPEWFAFDALHGYHTPSFLARILVDSDQLSDEDEELANTLAIDEIVSENVTGIYRKVSREFPDTD